jgi:hypothetical protein
LPEGNQIEANRDELSGHYTADRHGGPSEAVIQRGDDKKRDEAY